MASRPRRREDKHLRIVTGKPKEAFATLEGLNHCGRKVRFSKAEAEHETTIRNILKDKEEQPYGGYLCNYCSHYHVGHIQTKKQQSNKKNNQTNLETAT